MNMARILPTLLLAGLLCAWGQLLRADFGCGGDYSGGSDYGGSGSDYGGSSSDYSSSGSSDYGSGGGSDDPIAGFIGFAALLAVAAVGWLIDKFERRSGRRAAASVASAPPDWAAAIRASDPNFSGPLFVDFANLVFVKYHQARGREGKRDSIMPYVSAPLRDALPREEIVIDGVVVGGRRVESVIEHASATRISVVFRANVFRVRGGTRLKDFVEQVLVFSRPKGVLTPDPSVVMRLGCPSCGSPEEPRSSGHCPSCGSLSATGEMAWQVVAVDTRREEPRGEEQRRLGHHNNGLDHPTLVDSGLQAALRALTSRDPGFSRQSFVLRASFVFKELQLGWAARDVLRLRAHLSDGLYNSVRFGLERHDNQHLRAIIKDIDVYRVEVAKVEHDAWFDTVTARIFARMLDYTLEAQGNLYKGDHKEKRDYSEYWTFIRRSDRPHRPSVQGQCPSCGGPLDKINQAGVCGYCNSKIVSGDFDWVLCRIEQDEEYRG